MIGYEGRFQIVSVSDVKVSSDTGIKTFSITVKTPNKERSVDGSIHFNKDGSPCILYNHYREHSFRVPYDENSHANMVAAMKSHVEIQVCENY